MDKKTTILGIAWLAALPILLMGPPPAAAADDPAAIAARAFDQRLAGEVDEAVATLENALAEYPAAGVLHYELARARLQLLDIPGMQEAARAAVRHAPDNNDFRYFAAMAAGYSLIDAAHQQDRTRMKTMGQEAFAQLEAILQADPDDHEARYFLVQLKVDMAPEVAIEVADPEADVALLEKKDPVLGAKARCCLVEPAKQHELWDGILAEYPEDGRALAEAAEGFILAGDLELAETCLDKAIAQARDHCYGLLRLGQAYAMKQDWDRSLDLTRKYLDTDPPHALKAYATWRMGKILQLKGDREEGGKLTKTAREMDPHVWPTVMPPPKEIFTPL